MRSPVESDVLQAVSSASVSLEHWGWRYAGREAWTLRDFTLQISPGERVLLLGASGSGKSTLLRAMAGLVNSVEDGEAEGELLVDDAVAGSVRGRAGLVLQEPDAQVMLARVGDDVAFGCENLGLPREQIWPRVTRSLEAVGLELPLDHPTNELSGGQKQRLALAGVLAMQPGLILLDEPTAMLDPAGVREVRDAVANLVADRAGTLVIVEHRVDVWRDLVDRVVVLGRRGEILVDGDPNEVFTEHADALHELGVWMPGGVPERLTTDQPAPTSGARSRELITAEHLAVGWQGVIAASVPDGFAVRSGSVTALTAPNGAGKSTLALTLGGLLDPVAGKVNAAAIADGLRPEPNSWTSKQLISRIGSVFQTPDHQFVTATVREELELALTLQRIPDDERARRVEELASRLRLDHLLNANPFTLSGGEKRRLSVASALAARPPVLILDEPTFGQDAHTWRETAELITALRDQGSAILVVTHDEVFVETVADREVRLKPATDPASQPAANHPVVDQSAADQTGSLTARPSADRARPGIHPVVRSTARIHTVNPLAKLIAATVLTVGLVLSIDWVSASIALACELVLFLWAGLTLRQFARRALPIAVAALLAGVTILLYGQSSGATYFEFLLIHISDGSIDLAIATVLRVLAIALPAVILFATVDPTDLADSLEQHTRLPARFVVGALAALRLLTVVGDDWAALSRARRARGIGDARLIPRFMHQTFALLVLSMRRADKLATAMEARGFGGRQQRSWARTSVFGTADVVLIAIGCGVAALAIAGSVATGHWNFIFGGVA